MPPINPQLLQAAGAGDREAFAQIVREHFRVAYATAFAITQNPADAEDIVQDAFVRCWQRLGQCREPAAFGGWLRSIVRSVAFNHQERERVRATQPLEAAVSSTDSAEHHLTRSILRDRLLQGMEGLTPTQREVLLLYDLEGFRHAEIAGLLGVSELMSRRHLSNARRRMRRLLTEFENRSVGVGE